jgi:hypothetical protein
MYSPIYLGITRRRCKPCKIVYNPKVINAISNAFPANVSSSDTVYSTILLVFRAFCLVVPFKKTASVPMVIFTTPYKIRIIANGIRKAFVAIFID